MISRETWRSINKNYFVSVCKRLLKDWAYHELAEGRATAVVTSDYESRRKAKLKEFFETAGVSVNFNDTYIEAETSPALADLAQHVFDFNRDRPHFPSSDNFSEDSLRTIIRAFTHGSLAHGSDDDRGMLSPFRIRDLGRSHLPLIMFDKGQYAFANVGGDRLALSVDKFNTYLTRVKEVSLTQGLNYGDNITEYLETIGIKDGSRLMRLLGNGESTNHGQELWEDDGLPSLHTIRQTRRLRVSGQLDPETVFNDKLTSNNIKNKIKEIALKFKELDKDLTLLQYSDMVIKKAGGTDRMQKRYTESIETIVDKTYSKVSPNVRK